MRLLRRIKKSKIDFPFAMVIWKDEAKQFKVGGDELKKIVLVSNGYIVDEKEYFKSYIEHYENLGFPVIDMTSEYSLPVEILPKELKVEHHMGRIIL